MKFIKQIPDDVDIDVPLSERSPLNCIAVPVFVIAFWAIVIMLLLPSRGKGQSLSADFMIANDTACQYGIALHEVIGCAGLYAGVITKEDSRYDDTHCNNVNEFTGFVAGINYSLHCGHLRELNAGAGWITTCRLDKYGSDLSAITSRSFIAEAGASVMLLPWLDLMMRINSYPQVYTGLSIRLNF